MAKEVRASFLKPDFYQSGGGVTEGDYACTFDVKMHKGEKSEREARLGVQIHFHPLEGGEPIEWFYSMGTKAHESWAPTQDGKGITARVNGLGKPLPQLTNWQFFLDNLYNAGLPDTFDGDLAPLDGIYLHIKPTKSPNERKGFSSGNAATSEAGAPEQRQNDFPIGVPTLILPNGAPWEDGYLGMPEVSVAQAKKVNGVAGKATTAPAKTAAKKTAAVDHSGLDAGTAAITAVGEVLNKNPQGCSKLLLRTGAFKWIKDNVSDEVAQEAQNDILMNDDELGAILGMVDFKLENNKAVPA
jgi:hypothetical protein